MAAEIWIWQVRETNGIYYHPTTRRLFRDFCEQDVDHILSKVQSKLRVDSNKQASYVNTSGKLI